MKASKKINILSIAISSAIASIPISTLSILPELNSSSLKIDYKNTNSSKALNYSHHYAQNNIETIANNSGPMLLKENGKKIVNNDWYGNENWSLDVSTIDSSSNKIVDWDFMPSHNWIFVITNNSYVIKINSFNGEILARANISTILPNANKLARIDFNDSLYAWNSNNTSSKIVKLDRNTLIEDKNGITNGNTNGALVSIIPLDVGYSIGVYNSVATTDDTQTSSLTLKFIDDNGTKISNSNETSVSFTSKSIKDIAIYGFKRKVNANSTLLIVDNNFYEIKLNKSSIGESTVAKLDLKINSVVQTIKDVNSAFMDDNEIVYFKEKGGSKIYQIDFNNSLTISNDLATSNDTTIKSMATKSDNMLQIFPVPYTSSNRTYNTKGNIYLSDTDNTYINGIVNKTLYGTTSLENLKPDIKLKSDQYSNILSANVPSVVDQSFFASVNANPLDSTKVKLVANDIAGTLSVVAEVTKKSWFDNSSNVTTTSLIHKTYSASDNGSIKPKKIIDQISWATQQNFQSWFGKYTPDQLVESDLEKKEELISLKGINSKDYFRNLTKKIAIKSRDKNKGEIVLSGVVTYSDRYGNYINTPLIDQTYTIKKSNGTYSLKFYGSNNNANGVAQDQSLDSVTNKDINVLEITDSEDVIKLRNYLPSLIDPSEYDKFIKEENSYVPSRRTITKSANDVDGTMELTITYNGFASNVPYKFKQKFTGFLTEKQADVEFRGDDEKKEEIINQFQNDKPKDITSIAEFNKFKDNVSSEINPAQLGSIYVSKLDGMGYKPNIKIEPLDTKDYEYGSIVVTLDYSEKVGENKKLKEPYKNKFGLKDYKISQRYTGLLPIGVRFKMDINPDKAKEITYKYNVDSNIPVNDLISVLNLTEYKEDEISISSFAWNGEKFEFLATAQSKTYTSVQQTKKFILDWAPRFKNIRDRNMAIAISVAIIGTALISAGIALYVLRRNRIRRLLK